MPEQFFIYNGREYSAGTPVIGVDNRSLRYGDGLFETMKIRNGKIINKEYHFERLFHGLTLLKCNLSKELNQEFLEKKIHELVLKNNHTNTARVRLMVLRGNAGILEATHNDPHFIIESVAISEELLINENGYETDIYYGAKKSFDLFSSIKTNNYLPSVMAGLHAAKNNLDDCIILNSSERICESAVANIFIIKNKKIYTPPLSEACVAGTTRRCLLDNENFRQFDFNEKPLTVNDLLDAEEVFLTNSIYHIRWVKKIKNKTYSNHLTKKIYNHFLQTVVQ